MYKFTLCFLISLAIGLSSCGSSSSDSSSANSTYSSDDGALQLTLPSGFIDLTTMAQAQDSSIEGSYVSGSIETADQNRALSIQTSSSNLTGTNQHAFCGQSTAELHEVGSSFSVIIQLNSII